MTQMQIADRMLHRGRAPGEAGVKRLQIEERPFLAWRFWPMVCLAVFLAVWPARAELVDHVVVSVNNDVITLSELNTAVEFNTALGANGENMREQTLEGLINRRLLIQEARRLKFVDISEEDINAEMDKLKKRLGSDKALDGLFVRLDITKDQLRRILGERLLVERFVEKKIGLFIRVTRDEAQDYFHRNAGRFKDKRFPDVQKAIVTELQGQKLEQQMAQYLADLKSKADIRMNR